MPRLCLTDALRRGRRRNTPHVSPLHTNAFQPAEPPHLSRHPFGRNIVVSVAVATLGIIGATATAAAIQQRDSPTTFARGDAPPPPPISDSSNASSFLLTPPAPARPPAGFAHQPPSTPLYTPGRLASRLSGHWARHPLGVLSEPASAPEGWSSLRRRCHSSSGPP